MSTVAEIEAALKQLPVQEAQDVAQRLQKYLEHQGEAKPPPAKRWSMTGTAVQVRIQETTNMATTNNGNGNN